jgi:heptosyltransferase-3
MIASPDSILIVNTRLIGDVILTTPLLQMLKDAFPQAAIDFLVNRGTGEFLEKDPRVRKVIYSEKWKKSSSGLGSSYLLKLFRKYDLAITMNTGDRGATAVAVASKHYRVGYAQSDKPFSRFFRSLLFSHLIDFDETVHIADLCSQVARVLGIASQKVHVQLFWQPADADQVMDLLGTRVNPPGYLVIHPFARWRYKYWEISRFCEVSDRLARVHGLQPVWTSSPDPEEISLLQTAATGCSIKPLLIPGTLSLNQMACLLKGAALYIGLDTAITHIAASTGVPMVALYGPTELWRWHPWDNEHSLHEPVAFGYRGTIRSGRMVTLQAGCEHYPCIRPHCYGETENPCMMALTADTVCREAAQVLALKADFKDANHAG